jgi:hypothetical protein
MGKLPALFQSAVMVLTEMCPQKLPNLLKLSGPEPSLGGRMGYLLADADILSTTLLASQSRKLKALLQPVRIKKALPSYRQRHCRQLTLVALVVGKAETTEWLGARPYLRCSRTNSRAREPLETWWM